jgi:hypothetical protein
VDTSKERKVGKEEKGSKVCVSENCYRFLFLGEFDEDTCSRVQGRKGRGIGVKPYSDLGAGSDRSDLNKEKLQ